MKVGDKVETTGYAGGRWHGEWFNVPFGSEGVVTSINEHDCEIDFDPIRGTVLKSRIKVREEMEPPTLSREIIKSLREQTQDWTFSECTADHKSGLSIWIANTILDTKVCRPFSRSLPLVDRFKIRHAVNKAKARKAVEMLSSTRM